MHNLKNNNKVKTNPFIQHLLGNVSFDTKRVIECVESISSGDTDDTLRILAYLSGYSNIPEIPETSACDDSATLTYYDFFANLVHYKYIATRELKVEEEYRYLNGQVHDSWYDIPLEARSGSGDFKITVKYWSTNSCTLERWFKN